MIPRARFGFLLRISLVIAGLIILFFSGVLPIEDILVLPPEDLTASIAASEVASLTNGERVKTGLAPLSVSPLLTQAAQDKAEDMAARSYYAHIAPDGKTPLYWLQRVGYKYLNAGENLVIDRDTSEEAVEAWMHSPDHRDNILRPQFTEIGIGVAEGEYDGVKTIFVVQEFGTPYPAIRTIAAAGKPAPSAPVTSAKTVVTVKEAEAKQSALPAPVLPELELPRPAALPKIAVLSPKKASMPKLRIATTSPSIASSTPAHNASTSPNQSTSTVTYALAPEFYTPVTITPDIASTGAMAAPQGDSTSRLAQWAGDIKTYFQHLFRPLRKPAS